MRFGLTVQEQPTLEATLVEFERAEALGVRTAWFPHFYGFDALVVAALAASRTSTIQLGTAIVPMYPRHPIMTAQAAQAAQCAASGRLILGVGAGHRDHITHDYGLAFEQPISFAREYLSILRQLLRGERVDHEGAIFHVHAQLPAGRVNVEVVLGAVGPQMLRVAGEVADGAITWLCDAEYLGAVGLPALAQGAASEGRTVPELYAGLPICVHDDIEAARRAVAMWLAHHSTLESYRNALDRVMPGRGPEDVALIGSEEHILMRVRKLSDIGVTELGFVPLPAGDDLQGSLDRTHSFIAQLATRE